MLSWALTHTLLYLVTRMLTTRTSCPSRACTRLPWSYCAPSSEWLFPMPVDRDPGPCLALLASFLPHERRSSKSECGRNAAASSFTALQLFPLYCLVLSCLIHLGPPIPIPLLGLLFVSRTVHHPHYLAGTRAAVQCASFSPRALPCQPASPAILPACPPCPFALPCVVLYIDTSGYVRIYSTYCAVSSCRLQEPYCWNHTTKSTYLMTAPAGRCVICGIRFDPPSLLS